VYGTAYEWGDNELSRCAALQGPLNQRLKPKKLRTTPKWCHLPNSNNSAVVGLHSNEVMLTSVDLNLICGLWFLVLCCRLCFRLAFYLFAKFYDQKLCKMFCEKLIAKFVFHL